jgi:TPP-dependent pyruvate/acetoin dehydrogenase alpha subunit
MAKTLNSKVEPDAPQTFSLISNEKLLAIYGTMLKCRLLEQTATELFQHGKIDSDLHGSAGREATAAAAGIDLEPMDTLCLAAGDWLPAFVKGMSPEMLFRILAPAATQQDGAAAIEAGNKNILLPSGDAHHVEVTTERAAAALAAKDGAVVLVFISPGSESLKPWQKVIAAAGSKNLPLIFIRYVDEASEPVTTGARSQSSRPEALYRGVPSIAVDALDPVAIYRVVYEAMVRARQRRGATLVECTLHPGSGAGGDGADSDPVGTMESYLKRKDIEPEPLNRQIVAAFHRDLELATRFLDR